MQFNFHSLSWWGAPKKFDTEIKERRISWLELFYDLIYVIAIARITHHLSLHLSMNGFLEYASLFILIFWGWLNGSLYHDLHGNEGFRTRIMTLWQMMIIAALAIMIDQEGSRRIANITVVFMLMQFYITYMWWSVGIYDKEHRKYSLPYIVLFLSSLALMALSLYISQEWLKIIIPIVIIFNYTPAFFAHRLLRRESKDLNLSSAMSERLGLFTIIVFGELVLGVVNGISELHISDFSTWLSFGYALIIVFSLWWIFFTLASNREAKKGFVNATLLEMLYIPTLISLGIIAVSFTGLFNDHTFALQKIFGYAITIFFISMGLLLGMLESPDRLRMIIRPVRMSMFIVALVFLFSTFINTGMESRYYLLLVMIILIAEILFVNSLYYRSIGRKTADEDKSN